MKKRKGTNITLFVGIAFVLVAGVGFFMAMRGVQNLEGVMVAKTDIAAFSFVTEQELEVVDVPSSSIEESDLTAAEYEENYIVDGEDQGLVTTAQVLAGQRIDQRELAEDQSAAFSVVLPDERVVAATSTIPGAAVGVIQAGDVVDLSGSGGAIDSGIAGASEFAKVLCIATDPGQCRGVLPPGVNVAVGSGSGSSRGSSGSVLVLLAVAAPDAPSVAGSNVTMALNPFCRVDRTGHFYSTRPDEEAACEAPGGRLASLPGVGSGSEEFNESESTETTESTDSTETESTETTVPETETAP